MFIIPVVCVRKAVTLVLLLMFAEFRAVVASETYIGKLELRYLCISLQIYISANKKAMKIMRLFNNNKVLFNNEYRRLLSMFSRIFNFSWHKMYSIELYTV